MFVTATTSWGDSIPGTLLYYSDPIPTLHSRESLPPSAVLTHDIQLYATSGDLPKFTFISAFTGTESPFIFQGFLKPEDENNFSMLDGAADKMRDLRLGISLKGHEEDNEKLLLHDKNTELPVFSASEEAKQVQYETIASFQKSYKGLQFVKSWVGALTLLLKVATKEMMVLLHKPRSVIKKLLLHHSSSSITQKGAVNREGLFWLWWSVSKPTQFEKWVRHQSGRILTNAELQTMYREHHPFRAGFYRIWITEQETTENGPSVDICWLSEHEWIQYRVDVLYGKDDSEALGPNSSGRVKLGIQNKLSVPYSANGKWDMEDTFGLIMAFIVPDYGDDPCSISRSMGILKDEIEDLKNARFGPGTALEAGLKDALLKDAEISVKSMWKAV